MLLRNLIRFETYMNNVIPEAHILRLPVSIIRKLSCWKCGQNHKDGTHCSNCRAIQEPSKLNYFELLGLNISYDIDIQKMVSSYHNLQVQYHPDKHSKESEEEKQKAEEFSSIVNKAHSTLMDPLERGVYLLSLKGISIDEKGTSSNNQTLFLRMLKYNEEIMDANSTPKMEKLLKTFTADMKVLIESAAFAFRSQNYEKAEEFIITMKYHANLIKKVKHKMRKFL